VSRRRANNSNRAIDKQEPVIGLLTIELHFPNSRSLKEKRMVVKAIKDRLRSRFNAAVAEVGYQDLWQRALLAAVSISGERRVLETLLEAMARDVEQRHPPDLVQFAIELID
jgi:uncharacterized protein YlxP (DUF503 family)